MVDLKEHQKAELDEKIVKSEIEQFMSILFQEFFNSMQIILIKDLCFRQDNPKRYLNLLLKEWKSHAIEKFNNDNNILTIESEKGLEIGVDSVCSVIRNNVFPKKNKG